MSSTVAYYSVPAAFGEAVLAHPLVLENLAEHGSGDLQAFLDEVREGTVVDEDDLFDGGLEDLEAFAAHSGSRTLSDGFDPFDVTIEGMVAEVHFALTGLVFDVDDSSLSNAVYGGVRLDDTWMLLSPQQVRETADALAGVDEDSLQQRVTPERLRAVDLHQDVTSDDILDAVRELRNVFAEVAAARYALLKCVTP